MTDDNTQAPFPQPRGMSSMVKGLLAALLGIYVLFVVILWNSDKLPSDEFRSDVGTMAPDFSVTTVDGVQLKLSDLKGKRVVLARWATWCQPCLMEIPHLERLSEQSQDVVVLGVSDENEELVKAFVESRDISYYIAASNDLPDPFGNVSAFPTTFIIDREGRIEHAIVGYHDYSELARYALGDG